MLMHMRTTLILEESLVEQAREATGIREKSALVRAGLEALIAREAARRLGALGVGAEAPLYPQTPAEREALILVDTLVHPQTRRSGSCNRR